VAHKREGELIPLTKLERQLADRAYFANRIELLLKLKRLRMKRVKVKEAAKELSPLWTPPDSLHQVLMALRH
jgi:hypothetical protein